MRWTRPLYIMAKPPSALLAELVRLRAALGIDSTYAPDRLHNTFLPLGESTPAAIEAAHCAMRSFHGEQFPVAFDRIQGDTLQPQKGLRRAGPFQRALARHIAAYGTRLPRYEFGLHMNLAYRTGSDRRAPICPIGWTVEEIILVESVNGESRHVERGRWPLLARQGSFDF